LAEAVGGLAPVVTGEYRLGDVRHITADSSRLRAELGWAPQVDFPDGLAELAGSGQ
jgi:dTDP-L-rhamnose 4-epimerase